MATIINVHDLKTNYSKYLDQVVDGKEILLGKHGKAVAKMVALPNANVETRRLGMLKGKVWVSDDFDKPMTDLWGTLANKR
ncbi:MAG TPA: type II toxin-antitoxin system prevent-host-death family antitoxin [Candidatus Saccharimonadales bacterium]|nr:type II toxin-antitoxin system prevent-host-death family antitoxin [Candidatus Saccharimonadales bacterium]